VAVAVVHRRGVGVQHGGLLRVQAIGGVAAVTEQGVGVDGAAGGVLDEAVGGAVDRVATFGHALVDRDQQRLRYVGRRR
jgi:hypothetical protein